MQVYWEAALRLFSSLAPRTEARKVTKGKSGEGEEKERKGTAQREGEGDRERDEIKMSGLCREEPLGEGQPSF